MDCKFKCKHEDMCKWIGAIIDNTDICEICKHYEKELPIGITITYEPTYCDHDWVCVEITTGGYEYKCRKCGQTKYEPFISWTNPTYPYPYYPTYPYTDPIYVVTTTDSTSQWGIDIYDIRN